MRLRLVALLALLALAVTAAPAAAKPRAAKRLKAFSSCETLIGYATRHVPVAAPDAAAPPSWRTARAAPPTRPCPARGRRGAARTSSETNVQEAGVDEPDTVKTDGRTIFAIANGTLHAVDARGDVPRLLGTLALDESWGATMLLHKDRLFVLGGGPRGARITQVDVSDPGQAHGPAHRGRRRVHRRRAPDRPQRARRRRAPIPRRSTGRPSCARCRPAGCRRRTLTRARSGKTTTRRAVGCRSVRRPSVFSGAGVLTVYTIDLDKGLPAVDADAIFTSADTVYASLSSLYVATQRWDTAGAETTSIHRFDTSDPDRTGYAASGAVPGTLLNQFSLSEDKGVLRAATTVGWGSEAESKVTTLSERGGQLVQRGQVGGLGPGERIYAVRFIGDVGYVVTFRQTDPLYTVDLADPDRPRVVGELKIPGYSAYLHPVGDDLLLGVGPGGERRRPRPGPPDLALRRLGPRAAGTAAEGADRRALLELRRRVGPPRVPLVAGDEAGAAADRQPGVHRRWPASGSSGPAGSRRSGGSATRARDASWTPPIGRAVVVGDRLFTISDFGVKANGLAGFGERGWAAFPQPPQPPCDMPVPMPDAPVAEPAPCPVPIPID